MPSDITVRVRMLDDTTPEYGLKPSSLGSSLLHEIMKNLDVLESDYFGVSFDEGDGITFLDPERQIGKQIKKLNTTVLNFGVKFFTPDPSQIQDEYTRYLFALQVKRDISDGTLPCSETTALELASYITQAEFGDWNANECSTTSYLNEMKVFLNPTEEQLSKISQLHKNLMGKKPADVDYNLLDIARRLDFYGVHLYPALDAQNSHISLGVSHAGVHVFQESKRINTFSWARIRKLSFKRKTYLIKLRNTESENRRLHSHGDILVFIMNNRDACKNFWKMCVEHHAFFRLEVKPDLKPKPLVLSRGSSFHYSGKTQKELLELVRSSNFHRTNFVRTTSRKRMQNSSISSPAAADNQTYTLNLNSSSNQNVSDSVTSPSMTSEDQNSYAIDNYSSRLDYSQGADPNLSPDGQAGAGPDWRLKSESLHSSATPVARSVDVKMDTQDVKEENVANLTTSDTSLPKVILHSGGPHSSDDASTPTGTLSDSRKIDMSTRELKMSYSDDAKQSNNEAYYIAKEFLVTERNYIKDLEVIDKTFKEYLEEENRHLPGDVANQIFNTTDSLLTAHKHFKASLETRMLSWETPASHPQDKMVVKCGWIDDIIITHFQGLEKIFLLIENGEDLVQSIEKACSGDDQIDTACREFELKKVCYIPITRFLLQPMQRILHYSLLCDRLLDLYAKEGQASDHEQLQTAADDLKAFRCISLKNKLHRAHNFQKLAQLQHDLIGVGHLALDDRDFVREGSLYKLSRKGFQQRLFFLFSGCLLYTSKGVTSTNQFKVHGELPLQGMVIETNESDKTVPNCFSILSGYKTIVVAAASPEEMSKWTEDLNHYISLAKDKKSGSSLLSRTARPPSDMDHSDDSASSRSSLDQTPNRASNQQRTNTTMHVCWHRNTSVSADDYFVSLQNQLCGYLLRKFKNSNGWQKLWVVFTNFCLFFYKSHQDEFPLASLPLLGYSISAPAANDGIQKDYVFKLQFKTHVYYFRAESKYTYTRWMEVIHSATGSTKRVRLFSRMESTK